MLWLCTIHDDSEQFYEINELQIEIEYYFFSQTGYNYRQYMFYVITGFYV